jgi:hypothetical protein
VMSVFTALVLVPLAFVAAGPVALVPGIRAE